MGSTYEFEQTLSELELLQKRNINDSITQVRFDSRVLATIALYFNQEKEFIPSAPYLIRRVLEEYAHILVNNGLTKRVDMFQDARRVLSALRLDNLNPSGRNKKTRFINLAKERELEGKLDIAQAMNLSAKSRIDTSRQDYLINQAKEQLSSVKQEIGGKPADIEEAEAKVKAIFAKTLPELGQSITVTPDGDLDTFREVLLEVPKSLIIQKEEDANEDRQEDYSEHREE